MLEAHAPGAHAGRIEDVDQTDRRIGWARAYRYRELHSLVPADDLQGIDQSRVLGPVIPVDRQVIDVEEPLPRRLSRRAATRCPGELEIRIIDHRQSSVEAFQGKSDRVKGGECRQQHALLRQG